jgi:hypothetical protein
MPKPHPLPRHLRPRRKKLFTDGKQSPIDRNDRARVMWLGQLARRQGQITRAAVDILRARPEMPLAGQTKTLHLQHSELVNPLRTAKMDNRNFSSRDALPDKSRTHPERTRRLGNRQKFLRGTVIHAARVHSVHFGANARHCGAARPCSPAEEYGFLQTSRGAIARTGFEHAANWGCRRG